MLITKLFGFLTTNLMLGKVKIILVLLVCIPTFLYSQNEKNMNAIKAKIRVVQKDDLVNIYAKVINNSGMNHENLNYTLFLIKKDQSNNLSKNRQSGKFSLLVNETKVLSKQQLNINDKGAIKIFLYVRNDKKVISKDSINITLIDKKYSSEKIEEKNIELTGLVVENTMTKLGKDFYDYYNQISQLNNINYPFIIVINEKPSLGGRNSEVSIVVEDEILYQFRTQPNEEYLYNNALEANRKIYKYHIKRKLLQKKEPTY